MSEGYSAAWWWRQARRGKRINAEHKSIISALRRFDLDRLVEICAAHRTGGFEGSVSGVPEAPRADGSRRQRLRPATGAHGGESVYLFPDD
jgi:DNA-binding GntR family transcriptional regulator